MGWFNSCRLTPCWLNREQLCDSVTGSEGESKRGDRLPGCTWVKEIKICVVCDHFPRQKNHASQPPFTFYQASPTSSPLPALTRTSQAGIIELTTLREHQPWHPPPPGPNPVTPWWVEGSWSDSVLPPLWPPRVWFCSGYSGNKSQKLISPSDVAHWSFLKVIEALLSAPPWLQSSDKVKILFTIPPSSLGASSTFLITCILRRCQQHWEKPVIVPKNRKHLKCLKSFW